VIIVGVRSFDFAKIEKRKKREEKKRKKEKKEKRKSITIE
jgi:hypothetical protein